jgi:hypothetical protein
MVHLDWSSKWTIHHRLYEDCQGTTYGDSTLTSQLGHILGSHFHTLSHRTVLPPCSLNLRDMVSPQKGVTWVSLGVDQTPSLPPKSGLNLNPGSYQSDEWNSQVGF